MRKKGAPELIYTMISLNLPEVSFGLGRGCRTGAQWGLVKTRERLSTHGTLKTGAGMSKP